MQQFCRLYSRQHLKPSTSSLGNNSAVRNVMTVQDILTGPLLSCLFEKLHVMSMLLELYLGRRPKNVYLWLRKRLSGGQSLVSPLLLPPPTPPCADQLNHGPKHCHVPSCTRHKLRSRSSVRGGGGGGALGTAGARSMGSEVICLGLHERPDGAVGSAEGPTRSENGSLYTFLQCKSAYEQLDSA